LKKLEVLIKVYLPQILVFESPIVNYRIQVSENGDIPQQN